MEKKIRLGMTNYTARNFVGNFASWINHELS